MQPVPWFHLSKEKKPFSKIFKKIQHFVKRQIMTLYFGLFQIKNRGFSNTSNLCPYSQFPVQQLGIEIHRINSYPFKTFKAFWWTRNFSGFDKQFNLSSFNVWWFVLLLKCKWNHCASDVENNSIFCVQADVWLCL